MAVYTVKQELYLSWKVQAIAKSHKCHKDISALFVNFFLFMMVNGHFVNLSTQQVIQVTLHEGDVFAICIELRHSKKYIIYSKSDAALLGQQLNLNHSQIVPTVLEQCCVRPVVNNIARTPKDALCCCFRLQASVTVFNQAVRSLIGYWFQNNEKTSSHCVGQR